MNEHTATIALIEDEAPIRRFLRTSLELAGMDVIEAETAQRGLITVASRQPDLVILDLGLPDQDGLEVIRQLRDWTDLPILVLSARSQESEKVAALDAGADDYLTKPFGVDECLARVRVLLRRHAGRSAKNTQTFSFGEIRVDLVQRQVYRQEQQIHLTPIEYRLLGVLIREAGKVRTHRELLRQVWGPNHSESGQYLRVYMGHLRQKLERDPALPEHLITETGVGYKLIA
ncbi:two-component system response regulator KdpE [Chitinibacter sp. FCG-7]|uniref:Two-component system response regulator KdpE n=1 Tax=Chitinibacter mangrovi TaxID=3153927 RepID=A0AAU7F636_9NEIS